MEEFVSSARSIGDNARHLEWCTKYRYRMFGKEEFMQHYNQRSNVESVFSSIKKKFGDSLKSKNRVAQVNELLCKLLAYSLCVLIQEMQECDVKNFLFKCKNS